MPLHYIFTYTTSVEHPDALIMPLWRKHPIEQNTWTVCFRSIVVGLMAVKITFLSLQPCWLLCEVQWCFVPNANTVHDNMCTMTMLTCWHLLISTTHKVPLWLMVMSFSFVGIYKPKCRTDLNSSSGHDSLSAPDFMAIHQIVVNIFNWTPKMSTGWGR